MWHAYTAKCLQELGVFILAFSIMHVELGQNLLTCTKLHTPTVAVWSNSETGGLCT